MGDYDLGNKQSNIFLTVNGRGWTRSYALHFYNIRYATFFETNFNSRLKFLSFSDSDILILFVAMVMMGNTLHIR